MTNPKTVSTESDSGKHCELKMKVNLKELKEGGSDSPLKKDIAKSDSVSASGSNNNPKIMLKITKDKIKSHSSAHKSHKQHRKRSHSPGASTVGSAPNTPAVPLKMPRNDSTASIGFDINGTMTNSPSAADLNKGINDLQKLIEKQKKNIELTKKIDPQSTK